MVALYRRHGRWGAISKTNGIFLRSRDPVYRDLRELAMSYFHEYANRRNDKTLREYSLPYDLRRIDPRVWVSGEKGAWAVAEALDDIRHFRLVAGRHLRLVSRRDPFERRAGALSQYRTPRVLIEKEKLLKAKRALARGSAPRAAAKCRRLLLLLDLADLLDARREALRVALPVLRELGRIEVAAPASDLLHRAPELLARSRPPSPPPSACETTGAGVAAGANTPDQM